MTDNEIIKALERCVKDGYPYGCEGCPYRAEDCNERLDADALDLINRLQVKNERLKENLNIELENYATEYDYKIKAEAYKEFAERLKEYREIVSYDRDFDAYVYGSHIHIDIDEFENLVKEIAGEQ